MLEERKDLFDIGGVFEDLDEYVDPIDAINSALRANLPVFLHGKPGSGKSQRVKEIDEDAKTLELALLPIEELTGITVYDGKEIKKIMPEWLKELYETCKKEPKKDHILFLDELTNAPDAIQALAYSLVLERKVANKWQLPKNVKIIAAGNEVEDSIAASDMPEPLKNRFAHINIREDLDSWVDWAIGHSIDQRIIEFALNRGIRFTTSDGVRITPRTLERASKLLKITNDRRFLSMVIGEEETANIPVSITGSALDDNYDDMLPTVVSNGYVLIDEV